MGGVCAASRYSACKGRLCEAHRAVDEASVRHVEINELLLVEDFGFVLRRRVVVPHRVPADAVRVAPVSDGSSAACANLVEQNVAVPQYEEVTIDVDEVSDLVEQVARRSTVIHSDGAREGVAAAAEGELDRAQDRAQRRVNYTAEAGVAAEAAEAVEEGDQQRDRHGG
eukprot:scaffold110740_cov67-Phaeocystis_antarctica.AAC.5